MNKTANEQKRFYLLMQLAFLIRQFEIKLVKYSNNSFKVITEPLTYFTVTLQLKYLNTIVFASGLRTMDCKLRWNKNRSLNCLLVF